MPRRPVSSRFQKEAFMVLRCAARPGVPARTSMKGALARTLWLALSSALPTSRSSVCASSSNTASGFLMHRAVNSFRRFLKRPSGGPHSMEPTAATPTFRGSRSASPGGDSISTSASRVGMSSGVRSSTSTSASRSRQVRSNQLSNTVLPAPLGPVRATLCGGELPPSRSPRHCFSTVFSRSRPASVGGAAPSPGANTRCAGVSMAC